jgi:phospholipid-transporting ATPase
MSCFNVIFTFLPPLCIGIFDQFVSARMLDKYPQMYMLGQTNEFFNQKKFWGWFGNAVFHSLVSLTGNQTKSRLIVILL